MTNNLTSIFPRFARRLVGVVVAGALVVGLIVFTMGSNDGSDDDGGDIAGPTPVAAPSTPANADPHPPKPPELDSRLVKFQARSEFIRYVDDIEPAVRLYWSDMLRDMRDTEWSQAALERLIPEPDAEVKASLAKTLGVLGVKEAVTLLNNSLSTVDPSHRVWYREALCRLDHRPSCQKLQRMTRQRDLPVAFKATLAVADMSGPGDRKAIRALTALASREVELKQFDGLAGISILARLARLRHQRAHDELVTLLEHNDEQVRLAAAKGMAWIGDDTGQEVLMNVFNDGQSAYRLDAAVALVWLGNYAGHAYLRDRLGDASAGVRRLSARTLGTIGDRDNLRKLTGLYEDRDHGVRIAAAAAVLFILGLDPRLLAQDSVDWVMATFHAEDWRIRQSAAAPLRYLEPAQAIPLLAQGIVDSEPQVRARFASEAAHLGPQAAPIVAEALRFEVDIAVKEAQIATLAKLKDPVVKDTLEELASTNSRVGVLALGALIAVGETAGVARLADAFAAGTRELRLAAVEAAVLADEREVLPMLENALDDVVTAVRLAAAKALAFYGVTSDRVVDILRSALKKAPAVAHDALAALLAAGIPVEEGTDAAALLDSSNEDVRNAVLRAVSSKSWKQAEPVLRKAMRHPNPEVRRQATDVLHSFAQTHSKAVIPMLKIAVQDDDPVTRMKSKAQLSRLLPTIPRPQPSPKLANSAAVSDDVETEATHAEAAHTETSEDVVETNSSINHAEHALQALNRERLAFDNIEREIATMLAKLASETAGRAGNERDVEDVEQLAQDLRKAQKQLLAAYGRVGIAANAVRGVQDDASDISADAQKRAQANQHIEEARLLVTKSSDRVETAIDNATAWLNKEKADCPFYLAAAEAAIATMQPVVARRELRRADQTCRGKRQHTPKLDYAWALFHDMAADQANNDKRRLRALTRARTRYQKFIAFGSGVRLKQAQQRINEIDEELGDVTDNR